MCFKAVSGLKINTEKSELILIELVETVEKLALSFGCRVGYFPTIYLGLHLGCDAWTLQK